MSKRRAGVARTIGPPRIGGASAFDLLALSFTPALYYPHSEASGTTMLDASGHGIDGTYGATGVTLGATSLLTNDTTTAVTWSGAGTANGVVAYNSIMDNNTALSGFVFCKTSTSGCPLIDRDDNPGSKRVFAFRLNGGNLEFVKLFGTGGLVTATSPATYNNNVTHMLGFTYDGTNIRLYADGAKVQTTSASGALSGATSQINVGVNIAGTTSMTGTQQKTALYTQVLTDQNFADLWAAR